jgi:hypothetical protein
MAASSPSTESGSDCGPTTPENLPGMGYRVGQVSSEQVWVLVGGALALTLLVLVLLARRAATRSARELATARAEARALAERLAVIEEALARTAVPDRVPEDDAHSYVITHLGDEEPDEDQTPAPVVGRIDGKLFADIVARESAIKAVGLAHCLRRALAPEVRNRIRFEMRREVQRARKQRRADLKAALRDFRARERADLAQGEVQREDERHDEGDAA